MKWIIKRESHFSYLGMLPTAAMAKGEGPWRPNRGDALRFLSLEDARDALKEVNRCDRAHIVRLVRRTPRQQSGGDT